MADLNLQEVRTLQDELAYHPIYESLRSVADLRVFMQHHVFSVWDFMSLVKYMQGRLAAIRVPWMPQGDPALRHFINRLVLEEESDTTPGETPGYASHLELYLDAMREVGADTETVSRFLARVASDGVDAALYSDFVPIPVRYFCETTFCFIREDKPHLVAAALAIGRERIIPDMFRRLVSALEQSGTEAPLLRYYLDRHINLDGDEHGPLSMRMLEGLCEGDALKIEEAQVAAEEAICARLRFYDGILDAIQGVSKAA